LCHAERSEHLLCAFLNFLDHETKGKSRFFVAEFTLSVGRRAPQNDTRE
jgi:hypothetical protein